jgi:carbamoyl-phosphate synthase large subunit
MKIGYGFIVQEYIEGTEFTVDAFISKTGEHFIYPRIRLCTYGGVSQVGRTTMDKEIIKVTKQIIEFLDFVGPINLQFIKKNNIPYLIEINPRLSGGIGITYANGANLPDMAIKDHFGESYTLPKLREGLVFRIFEEYKDESTNRD